MSLFQKYCLISLPKKKKVDHYIYRILWVDYLRKNQCVTQMLMTYILHLFSLPQQNVMRISSLRVHQCNLCMSKELCAVTKIIIISSKCVCSSCSKIHLLFLKFPISSNCFSAWVYICMFA